VCDVGFRVDEEFFISMKYFGESPMIEAAMIARRVDDSLGNMSYGSEN
jgi:hypothetical protein